AVSAIYRTDADQPADWATGLSQPAKHDQQAICSRPELSGRLHDRQDPGSGLVAESPGFQPRQSFGHAARETRDAIRRTAEVRAALHLRTAVRPRQAVRRVD